MQVLVPCLIFLAVENVKLVRNEKLDAQEVLDSTQLKNAVAKELLKKKLSHLESSRKQESLASFLIKGGRNTGLRAAPKSNFHKDDDPSRKQAQMANTFIASSNLLFGTKSQPRKSCNAAGKPVSKEGLDMGSLRQLSGYNEDGGDFSSLKESAKLTVVNESLSGVMKKRLFPRKAKQDPISCYLSDPKKVTCIHKDLIYKIALPSSKVADDEIGRIVESIYRAVEGKNSRSSLDGSVESAVGRKASRITSEAEGAPSMEDSLKKKRASEDYLKSVFLNNLLIANNKAALPNYNLNNPVFVPLLMPMALPKAAGYYSGLAIDPRLQIPENVSAGGDAFGQQAGRNVMLKNGYGQYLVPDGLALPELNVKQRSQANLTEEQEKRRNWLALMATNGLVPVDNKFMTQSVIQPSPRDIQGITEDKDRNKLTVAETGEVLDKLLNKRQERDTYSLRQQLRKKHHSTRESPNFRCHNDGRNHVLTKVVQKLSDPGGFILEEKKRCPCPCSTDMCTTPTRSTRKPTKCPSKCPMRLIIQVNNSSKCSSTESCTTTPKCSMCPDGCQPIPSCPFEPTTSKPSSAPNCCGDSDILSRVVSGGSNRNEEPVDSRQHLPLLPVQTGHLNWLPYSPQFQQNNNEENHKPYSPNNYAPTERQLGSAALVNRDQPHNTEQFQNGFMQQYSKKSNEPLGNVQASRVQDHTRFSPQNTIVQNQIQLNDQQPFSLRQNNGGSIHNAINGPEALEASNKQVNNVLHSKPVPETDCSNAASRQNDIKTKKHRDSFFARLRSKFYKGLSQDGELKKVATDRFQENQYNQSLFGAGKSMIGTSIFKFSPKNQTSGFGKNNSSVNQLDKTNRTIEQPCTADQMNQTKDPAQTSTNQTQPPTVNNINITITSMEPSANNHSNQPQSPKISVQCPSVTSSTTQASTTNGRICTVTKIWLCSQQQTTIGSKSSCGNLTQPSICPSVQTTQPSTCQTQSTTNDPGSCAIQDQRSMNVMIPQVNTTTGTKISGVTEAQYWYPHPRPLWPFSSNYQTVGPAVQRIPQERPNTLDVNSPPPGWNQWQYPADRTNNAPPTDRALNMQQPQRMPTPPTERVNMQQPQRMTPVPQPKLLERRPPPQIQGQPENPEWHHNYVPPQNELPGPQPPSQQLDPRWQAPINIGIPNNHHPNLQPSLPIEHINNGIDYNQGNDMKPNDERKTTSYKTLGSGIMMGVGKHNLSNTIEQDIARVRRYLWKKRSKTPQHHLSRKS